MDRTRRSRGTLRISAKTDYALRALTELAAVPPGHGLVKGDRIAAAQGIPVRFLETIMVELRRASIVESRRGTEGGYALARPPSQIALADVIRALDGPLASVSGTPPETLDYAGSAGALREVWVATRAALRSILENTTLADVAFNQLPREVMTMVTDPAAWAPSADHGALATGMEARLLEPE